MNAATTTKPLAETAAEFLVRQVREFLRGVGGGVGDGDVPHAVLVEEPLQRGVF